MKRSLEVMGVLALAILGAVPAQGGILFNNFGPGDSYNDGSGWIVSGPESVVGQYASAQAFFPVITGTVTEVRFAADLDALDGGLNRIVFNLLSDDNGAPGAVLESYSFVDKMGFAGLPNPPLVVTSSSHPLLMAGARYWIVAAAGADTFAGWDFNDQGATGTILYSDDGGANWHPDGPSHTLGAFAVLGTAVPEPSGLTLLMLGGLTLAGWFRLRSSRW
jgi:hypothetical protein